MKLLNKFLLTLICAATICSCSAMTPEQQARVNRQLMDAAARGDLQAAQQALAAGADIHTYDDVALRWAAQTGHLLVVQYLLELPEGERADIHAENDYALQWAARYGHLAVVQFLVEHGADIHAENDAALRIAAREHYWAVAEYLLQHAADQRVLSEDLLRHLLPNLILPELQTAVATNNWHRVEELLSIVPVQGISADLQDLVRNLLVPAVQNKLYSARSVLFARTQIRNTDLALRTLSFIMGPNTRAAFIYFIKEDTHEITQ